MQGEQFFDDGNLSNLIAVCHTHIEQLLNFQETNALSRQVDSKCQTSEMFWARIVVAISVAAYLVEGEHQRLLAKASGTLLRFSLFHLHNIHFVIVILSQRSGAISYALQETVNLPYPGCERET